MPSALELGGQEHVRNPLGQLEAHHTGPQGQHIGVVVPPGHFSDQRVPAQGAPDALDLVGGDGNADTGGAYDNPPLAPALRHSPGRCRAEIGVVTALGGVGPAVHNGVALTLQIGF